MDHAEIIDILNRFAFYRQAPEKWQQTFVKNAIYREGKTGDVFFREGDACEFIAFIGGGSIRVYKISDIGRQITLYHVLPGESCVLNMTCTLARIPYPANAQVEQETQLVLFESRHFRDWVGQVDGLREFAFSLLAQRMTQMMTLLEEISFKKMDARLAEFLGRQFANQGRPLRVLHLTHEQIASELGTAREVITRLLHEFQRIGAIDLARGRIRLKDENVLKSLM